MQTTTNSANAANTIAAALAIATGKSVHTVCVHCLHATDPHEEHYARMIPAGGDCELCTFSDPGCRGARRDASDMFVTTNPNLPQCPAQALTLHVVCGKLAGARL
jgi:hypothetical protein